MSINQASTERLIQKALGNHLKVSTCRQISARSSIVARVEVVNYLNSSFILKFPNQLLNQPSSSAENEFLNEQLAYHFLSKLSKEEKFNPRALAIDPRNLLILEDLGERRPNEKRLSFDQLVARLAKAIAHLHGTTFGKYELYQQARDELKLSAKPDNQEILGKLGCNCLYRIGVDFICHHFATSQCKKHQRDMAKELEQISDYIQNPQHFSALIHGDLSNARQTFEVDDKILLLDFEFSKFSLCLLDFVKPLIGWLERNVQNEAYYWTQMCFPIQLLSSYRKQLASLYQTTFNETEWQLGIFQALTFGALSLIGKICTLPPHLTLAGTINQNIQGILARLSSLLSQLEYQSPFSSFVQQYTSVNHSLNNITKL